jgi:hypothetical protein
LRRHEYGILPQFDVGGIWVADAEIIAQAVNPNLKARNTVWDFSFKHSVDTFTRVHHSS